jgi:hypothetical protein
MTGGPAERGRPPGRTSGGAAAVRPELRAVLWRWRDVLAGLGVAAAGIWLAGAGGLLTWIGGAAGLAGLAFAVAGVQRARFRASGAGPGLVRVVEGQLAYFGPATGGVIDVQTLRRIDYRDGLWRLHGAGTTLEIPADAAGAEALFDVFASLPGLGAETVLAAMRAPDGATRTVWQSGQPRLH